MGVFGLYEMYTIELLILIFVLVSRMIIKKQESRDSTTLIEETKQVCESEVDVCLIDKKHLESVLRSNSRFRSFGRPLNQTESFARNKTETEFDFRDEDHVAYIDSLKEKPQLKMKSDTEASNEM